MAVPKRRVTRSRRDMRRSHHFLTPKNTSYETMTEEIHLRHHITKTGIYRGKKLIDIKEKSRKVIE